ncbi:MAG: AraC family transcriptional regulator [Lachnospiraceae bacterium]|nr:AraC family transcriptional regulator [Lachnospiraceae bacterium]
MYTFELSIAKPLHYNYTGKFEAPSQNWVHENFPLIDYELFVITEGTLYIAYNEDRFEVKAGEFLLLPPGIPPNNRRRGYYPSACSFYWMHFEDAAAPIKKEIPDEKYGECLASLSDTSLLLPMQGAIPAPEKIIVLMKQLQNAVRSNYHTHTLDYSATVILSTLCDQLRLFHDADTIKIKKNQKQIYHDIIDYVKTNVHVSLKVTDVANHFGYNEKYLSHLFGSIAGIPLKQFILTNKMETANFMLTDSNASITDIAFSLGFIDSHNFAKAYKKVVGLTPSEYRNSFEKRMLFHK